VDGIALCQCPHGKFEKFWISFEPKVRCSVRHCDPLTTGLTQRLFLSMTGAILHQPALAKRPAVAGARPIGAIESFPVHRILGWLSIFRSNKDTDWLLSQPLSSRKLRDTTRKTIAFSKELPWLEKHLWLSLAYYHFCLPHQSLRQRLPAPEPTRGSGTPRRWQPVTPAMAAGMTDRVWTTAELLGYRVPATFLDRLHEIEQLFPDPDSVYHVN
jgi:hypothetical protein